MEDILKKSMVIYLLTDNTNTMQYVGKTTRTLGKRLRGHRQVHNTVVDKAIYEHGWENFTVEILEQCDNTSELTAREIYWIAKLGTKFPNGYNMTDGGEGSSGYVFSQESIVKLRESHLKYHVVCVENGMIFDSARQAAEWVGVTVASIFRACNGHARSAGGKHWYYLEAPELADHEVRKPKIKNMRAVICVELNITFESVRAAAKAIGVNTASIIRACNKSNRTVKGCHWVYADSPFVDKTPVNRAKRSVHCVEADLDFDSIVEAAEWADIKDDSIRNAVKTGQRAADGRHWVYNGEPLYSSERKFKGRPLQAVRCVELNMDFPSIKAAAEWAGTKPTNISDALDKPHRKCRGYHWLRIPSAAS